MAEYPKRDKYFAHRFTRLLFHVCAGQEIGPDAVLLLVAIVHTEDAKRYSDAVTYWNENLADVLGFSVSSLVRARARAVKGGWLHYEPGKKGRAARYWVVIPRRFKTIPDNIMGAHDLDTLVCQDDKESDIPCQVDNESGGNPAGIRRECDKHSYLALDPPPPPKIFSFFQRNEAPKDLPTQGDILAVANPIWFRLTRHPDLSPDLRQQDVVWIAAACHLFGFITGQELQHCVDRAAIKAKGDRFEYLRSSIEGKLKSYGRDYDHVVRQLPAFPRETAG